MPTTIVWFSRHRPTRRQLASLRHLFGPSVSVKRDTRPFDGASDIISRYQKLGATEMVIVAPLTVTRELMRYGIQPIIAEMKECSAAHRDCEVSVRTYSGKPRHYRFIKFSRLTSITLGFEDIIPFIPPSAAEPTTKHQTPVQGEPSHEVRS